MRPKERQPQFDDIDDLAHVFDEHVQQEDEWKIRLPKELGITLTELTRRALERDDLNAGDDKVRLGRMPKNGDDREQLGDEWKIRLPYDLGLRARRRAERDAISLSSLARRAVSGYLESRDEEETPLF